MVALVLRKLSCQFIESGLFVVGLGVVLVLVVSRSRTCCVVVGVWSCWLFESAAYEVAFHSIPFRADFRRGEPGQVAREIVAVSVGPVWL